MQGGQQYVQGGQQYVQGGQQYVQGGQQYVQGGQQYVQGGQQYVYEWSEGFISTSYRITSLRLEVLSSLSNLQVGWTPTVGRRQPLFQYFGSQFPYLQAASSIRNLRTRCDVIYAQYMSPVLMTGEVHTVSWYGKLMEKTTQKIQTQVLGQY